MTTPWPPSPEALRPRPVGARATRDEALRMLDGERAFAAALATRAIAEQWDSGMLGADGEGLPREREVFALLGVTRGLAVGRLRAAVESLREVMQRHEEDERSVTGLHPLQELVDELGLSQLARLVLMLVVAPRMWGEIAQLYSVVANQPGRAVVDEHMVRQLLGSIVNPHQLAYELSPTRPLGRFGLIRETTPDPRPFTGLAPDPIVVARLRGDPLDEDPLGELTILPAGKPIDELHLPAAIATALQHAIAERPPRPLRIVVRGREGSGRRTLLASLAALAHRRLAVVHLHQVADGARSVSEGLRRALERCWLAGWIPCVEGLDGLDQAERPVRDRLRRILADFPGPLGLRLERDAPPPIDPGYLRIDLPDLTETERLAIWQQALAGRAIAAPAEGEALAPLAARWRIGAGTIHRVVAEVADHAGATLSRERVDQAVSQHLQGRFGDVAEQVHHLPRLADLVLPSDIMDSMTEFLARMRMRRQVFEVWGMNQVTSTGRGITALFQGAPGTGKTMVACALARELEIELYRVDLSHVMSKWIGETERNLGNVFSAAEESQAIILFDEADSLFAKRTEVRSSNDRFANLEVNYLLQRLDSFGGVAILTTNLGAAIDPAFKRRLAFRVHFPIPDEEQRAQLWRAHLPPTLPIAGDLDLEDLARRYPLTGGSVRNCVMRAAFLAAAEQSILSQDHLLRAVRLEYRAAGKLSESGALE